MATLIVVERWRHYFKQDHFIFKIDHESLKYLLEQKIYSSIQRKGLIKLLRLRPVKIWRQGFYPSYCGSTHQVQPFHCLISFIHCQVCCRDLLESFSISFMACLLQLCQSEIRFLQVYFGLHYSSYWELNFA